MPPHAATLPQARGYLSTTSLPELLIRALARRSSGSFVFEAPNHDKSALVVASGRVIKVRTAEPIELLGRLLTDSGVIDPAMLERGLRVAQERKDRLGHALLELGALDRHILEQTLRDQLSRRLSWLAELPPESAFGFYDNVDLLDDRPACGADPLALIWRCMRDPRVVLPRQEAVLSALGARPLVLREHAALERFELPPGAHAKIESLRQHPLALDALVAHTGLDETWARRLVYALLLTRQLQPEGPTSTSTSSTPASIAARASLSPLSRPLSSIPPPSSSIPPRPSSIAPPPSSIPPRPSSIPPRPSSIAPRPSSIAPRSYSIAPPPSSIPARAAPSRSLRSPSTAHSERPERVEHALERASRLVRERTRAEGAAEAARAIEAAHEQISKRQFAEAERLVRGACHAEPDNPEHLAMHAWLRTQLGEHGTPAAAAQIAAAVDRAVMKAPGSVTVRFYRAQVLKRLGRDDEAYKDFRFVARRAPDQLDAVREVRLHQLRIRNKQKQSGVFSKLFLR